MLERQLSLQSPIGSTACFESGVQSNAKLPIPGAAGLSGYSTDLEGGRIASGLSPLPFVSPSLGLGPQMHPRLREPSSLASSPGYTARLYSSPAVHPAQPHDHHQQQQQQQRRCPPPTGGHVIDSSAHAWLSTSPQADDACDPGARGESRAGLFEAQHAQRGAEGPVCLEQSAGLPKDRVTSLNDAGSSLTTANVKARGDSVGHSSGAVVDPVPALQTNLAAIDAAISKAAAAVVLPPKLPVSQPATAASSRLIKEAADTAPGPAAFLPVQAAAAPNSVQLGETQAGDLHASGSFATSVLQKPVSMAPISLAPNLGQQAACLPPGNLAPIGPPAMRTMTCQGQSALPQLAAPTLPPIKAPAPSSGAVAHAVPSAAAALLPKKAASQSEHVTLGIVGSQSTSVLQVRPAQVGALSEAVQSEKSRLNLAGLPQQWVPPAEESHQQAGGGTDQRVSVSAASAVMLDEARAAGTARQAALAVLNDTVEYAPASRQAEAHHSLPDHLFGSSQNSSATAVGSNSCFQQSADQLPATAVTASTSQPTKADLTPATAVGSQPAARPQPVATVASIGQPQSLKAMTGPAIGQAQEADSPVGGRPSQSETAVTIGRGMGVMTAPQDLHAAHLVHVLQAHKVSQQLSGSHTQEGLKGRAGQEPGEALSAGKSLPSILEHGSGAAPVVGERQLGKHNKVC